MTFQDVIRTLLLTCESFSGFQQNRRVCAVRDPLGRVRLVLDEDSATTGFDREQLDQKLVQALGKFFVSPSLSTRGTDAERRIAGKLLESAEPWPPGWEVPLTDTLTGSDVKRSGFWSALQRTNSKQTWLYGERRDAPWPLASGAPAIVSFFSFKGGVGRTTAVGAMCNLLAMRDKKVVVVDLDLEAPGLATFLNADADRGVLDFISDYMASGSTELSNLSAQPRALSNVARQQVTVYSAGRMSWAFVEQLGRLDYATSARSGKSPVEEALIALLQEIREKVNPDFILLDARAGLHDLGGLSLHALAHVDVLLSRRSKQNMDGLELALTALGRRKHPEGLKRTLVVQAMAPKPARADDGAPIADALEPDVFSKAVYELFAKHIYPILGAVVAADSPDAVHHPLPLYYSADLNGISTFDEKSLLLEGADFKDLETRILELCTPPQDAPSSSGESNA